MPFNLNKSFNLEKVYADIIDDFGNCFIVYIAKVDIYFLRFWYFGLLNGCRENDMVEKWGFKNFRMPAISECLSLDQKGLQIHGIWQRLNDPIQLSVCLNKNTDKLTWDCHHPKAQAEIRFSDKVIKGFGYAETLTLPFFPGLLKINQLRWGRFLSENHAIIWLDIIGIRNLNRVYYNGKEYSDLRFESDFIEFSEHSFRLNFEEISTLRKGRLKDLLKSIPMLKLIVSNRILNVLEIKYKAKAFIYEKNTMLSKGWAIYEIVQWTK